MNEPSKIASLLKLTKVRNSKRPSITSHKWRFLKPESTKNISIQTPKVGLIPQTFLIDDAATVLSKESKLQFNEFHLVLDECYNSNPSRNSNIRSQFHTFQKGKITLNSFVDSAYPYKNEPDTTINRPLENLSVRSNKLLELKSQGSFISGTTRNMAIPIQDKYEKIIQNNAGNKKIKERSAIKTQLLKIIFAKFCKGGICLDCVCKIILTLKNI